MSSQRRPEHIAPPEIFYNTEEATKYASNSRMIEIQTRMSQRALDLLALTRPSLVLDIGCGSGLSGEVLTNNDHVWVGTDISPAMLSVAVAREVDGDVMCSDMGQGLPFRAGTFDAAISISALQWLCNADKKSHIPQRRLKVFFESLYKCLVRGARAVFQVYPESPQQMTLITSAAMRAGFTGGLVVDFPNSTRAKKMFLVLFVGGSSTQLPRAMDGKEDMDVDYDNNDDDDDDDDVTMRSSRPAGAASSSSSSSAGAGMLAGVQSSVQFTVAINAHQQRKKNRKNRAPVKSREWVLKKKERRAAQGKSTARASKYTARRRKDGF